MIIVPWSAPHYNNNVWVRNVDTEQSACQAAWTISPVFTAQTHERTYAGKATSQTKMCLTVLKKGKKWTNAAASSSISRHAYVFLVFLIELIFLSVIFITQKWSLLAACSMATGSMAACSVAACSMTACWRRSARVIYHVLCSNSSLCDDDRRNLN